MYILFYGALTIATVLAGMGQLLVYLEQNYDEQTARDLEIGSLCLATLSTILLQTLAVSNVKSIGDGLHKLGRLLTVYLSPMTTSADRCILRTSIQSMTHDMQTFWVSLPVVDVVDTALGQPRQRSSLALL